MAIRFDGQVAIVTGAGRGVGRDTALSLARRGAKVHVNDYGGGGNTMSPGSIDVAQAVVDEIIKEGGTAVADGSNVGGGRVGRNAIYGTRGFHNLNLTAEILAEHFEQARDMKESLLLTSTLSENQRYR
jgi:NAD(P)-dependent dehydrogenase (short-subunit alcohol dehydrogenase family)